MRLIRCVIGIAVVSVGIAGCDLSPSQSDLVQVLHRGNGGDPGSLDPALAEDIHAFNVLTDLFEGLVTVDAKVFQGRIQSETDEEIVLRGQESFAKPQRVRRADIEERLLSRVSMMPKATVNHLQRDEILDLLAYILAGTASDE